jgi:DNA-binding NarL/FixJ family response regulator
MLHGIGQESAHRRVWEGTLETRVIIYSMQREETGIVAALRNGAVGYVLKDAPAEEVVQAIRTVVGPPRHLYLSPALAGRGVEERANAR